MTPRFFSFLALVAAILTPSALFAQPAEGRYTLTAGGKVAAVLDISGDGDARRVTHERPHSFSLSVASLQEIELPLRRFKGGPGTMDGDYLTLTLRADGAPDKVVRVKSIDPDHLSLDYVGTSVAPLLFVRSDQPLDISAADDLPLPLDATWPDNPRITALFMADQAARQGPMDDSREAAIAMQKADAERRALIRSLLEAGEVRSGRDHYHAAFILQHGDLPADYLLAHVLATGAMARGHEAAWIAAATLDRYLESIGQPQIYGTQYSGVFDETDGSLTWSMGDYDDDLLTDTLRVLHAVPPRAAQEERLERYRSGE